jgi:hypothetical protein
VKLRRWSSGSCTAAEVGVVEEDVEEQPAGSDPAGRRPLVLLGWTVVE